VTLFPLREDPANPYGYIGKVNVLRQEAERETDQDRKSEVRAETLLVLEEGHEATSESEIVAHELAKEQAAMGSIDEARTIIKKAIGRRPGDERLRSLWITIECQEGQYDKALEIAEQGEKLDPTSWRIQRHLARIQRGLDAPVPTVRGHYEAAVRHHKGDLQLLVEYASYLFQEGLYPDANNVFSMAGRLGVASQEKRRIREWWKDATGKSREFHGRVKCMRGAMGIVLAIPENFEAAFWRNRTSVASLLQGSPVRFYVGFSAKGPIAHVIA
jgi:tetratricopeptide (TPR) repeat protein